MDGDVSFHTEDDSIPHDAVRSRSVIDPAVDGTIMGQDTIDGAAAWVTAWRP
jgi:hypothetical protein